MLKKLIQASKNKNLSGITNSDFLKSICGEKFPIGKYPARMICGKVDGRFETSVKALGIRGIVIKNFSIVPSTFDTNNYFCVSSFLPSSMSTFVDDHNVAHKIGDWSRKSEFFHQIKCISLDDIGNKVDPSLITLPPSAVIETSPGNYQVHYIVTGDDTYDRNKCEKVINGLADAGLTDGGAKGVNRFMRLPVGSNTKQHLCKKNGEFFRTQLVHWDPKMVYSLKELTEHYSLDLKPIRKRPIEVASIGVELRQDVEQYWSNVMMKLDPLISIPDTQIGKEWMAIECPWSENHTEKRLKGGYLASPGPRNGWVGAFHCFHKSCREKNMKDLFSFIGRGGNNVCK